MNATRDPFSVNGEPATRPEGPCAFTLALVGMPGCGKSTIGRLLARRLNQPFVDVDTAIETRAGCRISELFAQRGEAAFRDLESQVLAELLNGDPKVLATGGGAVLRPENRALLRQRSTVVYLRTPPEELARRVGRDARRPLLQGVDPLTRLRELHAVRHPLYKELARFTIDTGRASAQLVSHRVLMQLELSGWVSAWPGPAPGR